MTATRWFANHDNLLALAEWLDDRAMFDNPADVIAFFEKPWKWEAEWEALRRRVPDPGLPDPGESKEEDDA